MTKTEKIQERFNNRKKNQRKTAKKAKKILEETHDKLNPIVKKKYYPRKRSKPVSCIDIMTDKEVKQFDSIKFAGCWLTSYLGDYNEHVGKHRSGISNCINKRTNQYQGFIWREL